MPKYARNLVSVSPSIPNQPQIIGELFRPHTLFSCDDAAKHVHLCLCLSVHLSVSKLNFSLFTPLYTPLCPFVPF